MDAKLAIPRGRSVTAMRSHDWKTPLDAAHRRALEWLEGLPDRPVMPTPDAEALADALGRELPAEGQDAATVIDHLATAIEPGLTAMPSGRFFGWVIGGNLPAGVAADWLVAAWDQNVGMFDAAPGAAVLEHLTGEWVKDLLGLPMTSSVGFVTGAQVANMTCLAAARDAVLRRVGWDVEADGLQGAPKVHVVVGGQVHSTVRKALRILGLGERTADVVPADDQGRMDPAALSDLLDRLEGPTIVCAQAGEVNSGAFDDFNAIADACERHGAWIHVDGAFGLWAAAAPSRRHLTAGVERADSWCTDAHKTLSTPYDCGIAIVADPDAHRRAMSLRAAYLPDGTDGGLRRDAIDWNPEMSRRFRSLPVWAVLRQLGRDGVAELVERLCGLASELADRLSDIDGVEVVADVPFNQVLVRFGDDDAHTATVVDRVRDSGTAFMSPSVWRGEAVMRISVSNAGTDRDDLAMTIAAIAGAHAGT